MSNTAGFNYITDYQNRETRFSIEGPGAGGVSHSIRPSKNLKCSCGDLDELARDDRGGQFFVADVGNRDGCSYQLGAHQTERDVLLIEA